MAVILLSLAASTALSPRASKVNSKEHVGDLPVQVQTGPRPEPSCGLTVTVSWQCSEPAWFKSGFKEHAEDRQSLAVGTALSQRGSKVGSKEQATC